MRDVMEVMYLQISKTYPVIKTVQAENQGAPLPNWTDLNIHSHALEHQSVHHVRRPDCYSLKLSSLDAFRLHVVKNLSPIKVP